MQKTFSYRPGDKFAPIPPAEASLPTVEAELFMKVNDAPYTVLEGTCFDRTGDILYFVDCNYESAIKKIDFKTGELSTVLKVDDAVLSSLKVHKDGRLFMACTSNDFISPGGVFCCNPDGSDRQEILGVKDGKGYVVDDICFDNKGGFYLSDIVGWVHRPTGGIYYVSPDYQTVTCVEPNMAAANGVCLSPDQKVLWVTEILDGKLTRIALNEDGKSYGPFATTRVYNTTGHYGPDSIEIDADGNVYMAMYGQGRVLIFNSFGWPIGQILIPGRDEGKYLRVSHTAIRPGTKEVYICTACDEGNGSAIFKASSFAGADMNSFQFL